MRLLVIIFAMLLAPGSVCSNGVSKYVRSEPGNTSVIVFVHGVTGDAASTWKNERSGASFPELVAADPTFALENIYVYQYPTRAIGKSFNLNEIGENLRLRLGDEVTKRHQRVIFVAHSMGGLVVRQYLLKYREEEAKRTALMYFYATPTSGSPIAILARYFSDNPQFKDLVPEGVDQTLSNLSNDWSGVKSLGAIPNYCAYETLPMYFRKIVVSQSSATHLCNRRRDPMDADHAGIVKPESQRSDAYIAFRAAYLETIGGQPGSAGLLRAEVQNLQQAILRDGPPLRTRNGETVFCGSIRADLVVAHPGGTAPSVEISSIVVSSAPLDRAELDPGITCKVDRLGGAPHGIPERGVYFVTLNDRNVSTSYKDTGGVTREMDPGNVLRLKSGGSDTVRLPRGDTRRDIRDFRITTKAEQPQQLTFRISYDQDGEKKVETRRVVIWK